MKEWEEMTEEEKQAIVDLYKAYSDMCESILKELTKMYEVVHEAVEKAAELAVYHSRDKSREWPPKTDKECYLKIKKGFE